MIERLKSLRQWQWVLASIVLFIFVYLLNGQQWFTYLINGTLKASLGIFILYGASRTLTHSRTHQLVGQDKRIREIALIVGAAIVIAGAFSG